MPWEDVLINRSLTRDEVLTGLAQLFSITTGDILLVDGPLDFKTAPDAKVLCERHRTRGDFVMRLVIYLRDSQLGEPASLPLIGKFCELLHCECLISDDSVNPYSMLLVRGRDDWQTVYFDPELLDDHEEYVIKYTGQSDIGE